MVYHLPYPPSVNRHLRANYGQGRVLVSREWRDYKASVAKLLMVNGVGEPLAGRLSVEIIARVPDRRRRDLDNLLKCAIDSLCGIVYLDDSQIDQLTIKREYADDRIGQLIVNVSSI